MSGLAAPTTYPSVPAPCPPCQASGPLHQRPTPVADPSPHLTTSPFGFNHANNIWGERINKVNLCTCDFPVLLDLMVVIHWWGFFSQLPSSSSKKLNIELL